MPKKSEPTKIEADVFVSYTHHNQDFVEKFLLRNLKDAGINIWTEAPGVSEKGPSQRGKALIACHVYIPVMCSESALDSTLQDEVALAYISNKSIIPLGREIFRQVSKNTTSGIKLMLAKINWTFFVKEDQFDENINQLIDVINAEILARKTAPARECPETEDDAYTALNNHAPGINRPDFRDLAEEAKLSPRPPCEHTEEIINCDFWERNFTGRNEMFPTIVPCYTVACHGSPQEQFKVLWTDFKEVFLREYEEKIVDFLGEERTQWMVNILYKDILDLNKTITKRLYVSFCGKNVYSDPHHFFERLKEYCQGSFAIREVFHMESSVRLHAIQNLATFHSAAVITLLFDLVSDSDANTRAIAALALAKTGKKYKKISDKLIKLLDDEDRVVRESACLSLAHMKCSHAVPNIVDLWRNDAIKHVREAAEVALARIGGESAEEAMRVTKVLSDEMDRLKKRRETTC